MHQNHNGVLQNNNRKKRRRIASTGSNFRISIASFKWAESVANKYKSYKQYSVLSLQVPAWPSTGSQATQCLHQPDISSSLTKGHSWTMWILMYNVPVLHINISVDKNQWETNFNTCRHVIKNFVNGYKNQLRYRHPWDTILINGSWIYIYRHFYGDFNK